MKKIICMILLASGGWLMAQNKTITTVHGEKITYDARVNITERNNLPKTVGLMVFNTETKCHEFWDGNGWYNYCWGGYIDPATVITITTQPTAPAAVCSGTGTQTLTVVATGTGLTYQWKKDGTNLNNGGVIGGATSATLTLTNPTTANAGSYTVAVSNSTTTVTSNAVTTVVNALPTITATTPDSRTGTGTLILSATASAGATINWYDVPTNGTATTGASFTTPSLTATKTYYVEAFVNGCTSARIAVVATVSSSFVWNDVTSPATSKVWMDRNLGASQRARTINDYQAYGSLYQWGRGNDGHQLINWDSATTGTAQNGTTTTRSSGDTPGNSLFITTSGGPHRWQNTTNVNLWQGVAGINNPCPAGYRLPTNSEWDAEISVGGITNSTTAFTSVLKLPTTPYRDNTNGNIMVWSGGTNYWTGTYANGDSGRAATFFTTASTRDLIISGSAAVRCIKN